MERVKVLLVDDEKEFLESLVKVLNRRGFLALVCPAGRRHWGGWRGSPSMW